jgi:hypothetical protein
MLQNKKSPLLLTLLAVAGLFVSTGIAQALTISPARAELTGDPGETISQTFLLINEQDHDETFYTSVENFESQGETGTPNFTSSKEGLPGWVTVTDKVVLKKGERVTVPYNIVIPKDADAGGHFAAIFLSTIPPTANNSQVSVGAKVGMLVLLRVTGNIKEGGDLSFFSIKNGNKVLTSLPIDFAYKFRNNGNDREKPEGDIVIKNMLGVESGRVNANPQGGNVLPNSVRRFDVHYGEGDAPAISAPFFDQVKFQWSHLAFGVYFADLSLAYGASGKASSSLTYYIFPWQLTVVVLVGIFIVVTVLRIALKRYNKWIIKQARAAK